MAADMNETQLLAEIERLKAQIETVRLEEREACCAILGSAEPNTRAEKIIEKLLELHEEGELSDEAGDLLSEWLTVAADELGDMQANIRARGAPCP